MVESYDHDDEPVEHSRAVVNDGPRLHYVPDGPE
jgi:hypothetical protein